MSHLIGKIQLVVSYSRIGLRTSFHFDKSHWSDLLDNFYLPQVSTWFDPHKLTFTHTQMFLPRPHSLHHFSHPLRNIWRCCFYLRTELFHRSLKPVVRLGHVPPYSSLWEIPHSHLPPKTSTLPRQCVVEVDQILPTCVDHIRLPKVALCCQSHSPYHSRSPHRKLHLPTGGDQCHAQGSTLRLQHQSPTSRIVYQCFWKYC